MKLQKISPYLWFDNQAQEAANFYCSIFPNSRITSDGGMLVEFELDEINFIALNGGPQFKFNEAISFYVLCEDQEEIDRLWSGLISNGGSEGRCSWCKDKFGVSWQIVPKRFVEMMKTGTPEQSQKVISAMMTMSKMIIEDFEQAFNTSMKTLTYSIIIDKPCDFVFNKIMDKSDYPYWARAWGEGMSFQGEWKQGGNVTFFDTQGGTKVIIEELYQNQSIKMRHIAMVNADLNEVKLSDESMQKWIGSQENYYFKTTNDNETELQIVMVVDEDFQNMFDNAWPKALEYFKSVCDVEK